MMTNHFRRSLILIVLLGLLGSSTLTAQVSPDDLEVRPQDVLELTNGNRFVGKILIERDDFIKFETAGGSTTVQRSDIARILYSNPPEAVYEKRLKAIDRTRYEDQVELANWCLESEINLRNRAIGHFETAVEIDPAQSAAYEKLLPLYIGREFLTTDQEELDANLLRESEILLLGLRSGVDLGGMDLRDGAIRTLIRIGDIEAAVLR